MLSIARSVPGRVCLGLLLGILPGCPVYVGDDDDTTSGPADDDDADVEPALLLSLPLAEPEVYSLPVIGVDHDPDVYDGAYRLVCENYDAEPFPHCYDEHDGSDYLLEGSFEAMDAGSSAVIAAAPGTVVDTADGNYDRCHGDLETLEVSCDGYEMAGNGVYLKHEGGYYTLYWHFMKDSVAVEIGDEVDVGTVLGLVGSSGNSTQPHLHFEIQDLDGEPFDPYAGELSQPRSWWCEQGDLDGLPGSCD